MFYENKLYFCNVELNCAFWKSAANLLISSQSTEVILNPYIELPDCTIKHLTFFIIDYKVDRR